MIERTHPKLSVGAQCRLLSISGSSFYCPPQGGTAINLDLMLKVDKRFLETPFYGVRQMTWHMPNEGHASSEKRIRRLMRPMRRRRENSPPDRFLILLTQMRKGFLYLVAVMDWFTRKVLGWRIFNTLEADFCLVALNEAIHKFGPPEIMNTDQGSQFTSFDWTGRLKRTQTKSSMDGKARCLDNIFIESLWRSLRYESVNLHAWEIGSPAKVGVGRWITFYNPQRRHAAHGGQPPAMVYCNATQTDQPVQAVA